LLPMRTPRDQLVFISRHALVGGCAFNSEVAN
jgi:hypothetical protein